MPIGDNLPPLPTTADDARAYAAAIAALRDQIEAMEAEYKPHLDALAEETKSYRSERDGKTAPLSDQMETLRKILTAWLSADPDMQLKDGERVVATLAAGKPALHINEPALVPTEYCSPDKAKIEAALRLGKVVPGVTVSQTRILKVLA